MIEVQDIFRAYEEEYPRTHGMSAQQKKVFHDISNCRTERMGVHADVCPSCGYAKPSYNSCRNRHCPKCQFFAKERWIENQSFDLLNTRYFHVVFSIPQELHPLAYQNQRAVYTLLLRAAAQTLLELSADKKFLGAQIGCTTVLHTWGQNLMFHPHVHCIVTGGGLSPGGRWIQSRRKFFLPVKVLSRKFRGKFLAMLKRETLHFYGSAAYLSDKDMFQALLDDCYSKEWIAYCKPPFKDASCVVNYIGRYTHRVAISNNRILSFENGMVAFKWRDYRDGSRWKVMSVDAAEFIRRFLTHVLPKGFMKIRHYGILGNRGKSQRLLTCKRLTHTPLQAKKTLPTPELLKKIMGTDITLCPKCGAARMIHQPYRSPPYVA